jgi:hypothetical protein
MVDQQPGVEQTNPPTIAMKTRIASQKLRMGSWGWKKTTTMRY